MSETEKLLNALCLFDLSGFKYFIIVLFLFVRMFLFPPDLQLEMEYWAETGQFDDDELHEVL